MNLIDQIAEMRIQEAIARRELQGLSGEGKPLEPDDNSLVPTELRMAYRILKNAGYLPPEVEIRREIAQVEALIAGLDEHATAERRRAQLRIVVLRSRLEARGGGHSPLWADPVYQGKLIEAMVRHR
jgi:hypothetical protein